MKKLFLILLLSALFQPTLKAQCLDTIGINPPEIQGSYLMLIGWGVNEKPGGLFWGSIKRQNDEWAVGQAPWIDIFYGYLPDSCTGWIFSNQVDLATIKPNEVIYYQVHMVTIDGVQFHSPIIEYRIKTIISDNNPHFPSNLICKNYISSIHKDARKVKPNIVLEGSTIKVGNETNETMEVVLTDFSGQPIQTIKSRNSEIFLNVDKAGFYFLTLKKGNSIQTERIFIN